LTSSCTTIFYRIPTGHICSSEKDPICFKTLRYALVTNKNETCITRAAS
jgi:hypothetical protein